MANKINTKFKLSAKGFTPLKNIESCVKKTLNKSGYFFGNFNKSKASLTGFTLIELLIVIAIIGIITAVVVINISVSSKDKANISKGLSYADSVRAQLSTFEVAGFKFENNTNDTWNSGGTITSNGITYVTGVNNGSAAEFNSNTDYVRINNSSFLNNLANNITISMWVKLNNNISSGNYIGAINKQSAFFLYIDEGANCGDGAGVYEIWFTFGINGVGGNRLCCSDGITGISVGKWQHVIASSNTNLANPKKYIYIDGKLASTNSAICAGAPNPVVLPNINDAYIGNVNPNALNFGGLIDEVQIFNETLTAQQINRLYAESAPRHGIALK